MGKERTVGTSDFYRHYVSVSNNPVQRTLFTQVMREYNDLLMDMLMTGKEVMIHRLASLRIHRYETNPGRPRINWKESNALREELMKAGKHLWDGETGEKWMIFFDQKWYTRIHWTKNLSSLKMKNKKHYRFLPARGMTGPKTKLKNLLASDDLAYLNFTWKTYDI
jgi:hypothetical protein